MNGLKQISVNGIFYSFREEFDVNLTLSYENEHWQEWHIIREFISNALDSVGGDTSKIAISTDDNFVTIHDHGTGYPLVYAKRIGATNKKDDANLIGNFGEGVKMSLLTCVRNGIKILLASRNWLIEPKTAVAEGQEVLFYDIYEAEETVAGTTVVIGANERILEIINNISQYFLQFRQNDDCLHGSINEGIYPLLGKQARLYNKGVYVKEIDALYSYGISLESLNRDRDLISYHDIVYAVRNIWEIVDKMDLIKALIKTSTLPQQERENLVELRYTVYSEKKDAWNIAFTELYGSNALIYTNDFAEREAVALGYKVINCDYRIAETLSQAGVKHDSETLTEDYEFSFSAELEQEEAATLNKVYALVDLLDIEAPKSVKIFEEYENHSEIKGLYNHNNSQIYMRKNVLSSGLPEALNVFLHEANHHISGSDDVSRGFSDSLSKMLTDLLLKYAADVGIKSQAYITDMEIMLPNHCPINGMLYANIIAIGNRLNIYTADSTVEVELPLILTSPVCGTKKITAKKEGFALKLPGKIVSALSYTNTNEALNCVVRLKYDTERKLYNEA